jgi:hypothetical protein
MIVSSHTTPRSARERARRRRVSSSAARSPPVGRERTLVAHVVDFVKDDPGHLAHDLGAAVEHVAQNLGGHHQAGRARVYGRVAGHQADVLELLQQLAVLLVRQRFDGRGVDHALLVAKRHGDGVPARAVSSCRCRRRRCRRRMVLTRQPPSFRPTCAPRRARTGCAPSSRRPRAETGPVREARRPASADRPPARAAAASNTPA